MPNLYQITQSRGVEGVDIKSKGDNSEKELSLFDFLYMIEEDICTL